MKKSLFLISLLSVCLFATAQTSSDVVKTAKAAPASETIETATGPVAQSRSVAKTSDKKKLKIEICSCYDQVKPPCWKSTDLPPCPK